MGKENIEVYTSLRNEILEFQKAQRNYYIYMYIISISVFALEFQINNYYMFLLPYIIIISFQVYINRAKIAVQKISTYIKVFFEEEPTDIHWESLNDFSEMKDFQYIKVSKMPMIILRSNSLQLACLSSVFFIYNSINYIFSQLNSPNIKFIIIIQIMLILLSIILFAIIIGLTIQFHKIRNSQEIKEIITKYKKSIL